MITLVACDLDGTLLDGQGRLPAANRSAVVVARARGICFVLASARPPRSLRPHWTDLGLDEPVIAYNGAVIWDMVRGAPMWERVMPAELVAQVVRAVRSRLPRTVLALEAGDRWWTDRIEQAFQMGVRPPEAIGPVEALSVPAHKVLFTATTEEFARLDLSDGAAARRSRSGLVEIQAAGVGKESAVARLAPAAEVLAIGDEDVDVGMLRWAEASAAPRTASPAARAAARWLVGAPEVGAVAEALRTVLQGRA